MNGTSRASWMNGPVSVGASLSHTLVSGHQETIEKRHKMVEDTNKLKFKLAQPDTNGGNVD